MALLDRTLNNKEKKYDNWLIIHLDDGDWVEISLKSVGQNIIRERENDVAFSRPLWGSLRLFEGHAPRHMPIRLVMFPMYVWYYCYCIYMRSSGSKRSSPGPAPLAPSPVLAIIQRKSPLTHPCSVTRHSAVGCSSRCWLLRFIKPLIAYNIIIEYHNRPSRCRTTFIGKFRIGLFIVCISSILDLVIRMMYASLKRWVDFITKIFISCAAIRWV